MYWKDGKVTICDQKHFNSDYVNWGQGRLIDCNSFDHFWSHLLDEAETGPTKSRKEEPDKGMTTAKGIMLGWQEGGYVKGQINSIPVIGVDLDRGHQPEDIHDIADRLTFAAFCHETRNSRPGGRRYHLFAHLSRPLESKAEAEAILHHIDKVVGGVELQASNPNRVWSAIPAGMTHSAIVIDEKPPIDVDALTFMIPKGGDKPKKEKPKPTGDLDQQSTHEAMEEELRKAKLEIDGLRPGERHKPLCAIVVNFARQLFGAVEAGFVTEPDWWQEQIGAAILDNLERHPADDPDAAMRDAERVLADMWSEGERSPADVDLTEVIVDEMVDRAVDPTDSLGLTQPPFPLDLLPPDQKRATEALHFAVDAPLQLCAQAVLAATTMATQHLCNVRMSPTYETPLNNFFLALGYSGMRKSAVLSQVKKPWNEITAAERETYAEEQRAYAMLLKAYNDRAKDIDKRLKDMTREQIIEENKKLGPPPVAPLTPERQIDDPTIQSLVDDLRYTHPSTVWMLGEAGKWLGGHSMKAENSDGTVGYLNCLWDASELKPSRKSDQQGKDVRTYKPPIIGRRCSTLWCVQPRVAINFVQSEHLQAYGLIARFLPILTDESYRHDPTREYEQPELYQKALKNLNWFQEQLKKLALTASNVNPERPNELEIRSIPLSEEAQKRYVAELVKMEDLKFDDHPPYATIKEFAAKLVEHGIRLAGAFETFANPYAEEVSVENLERGLGLAHYYAQIWCLILRLPGSDKNGAKYSATLKWLLKSKHQQMSVAGLSYCPALTGLDPLVRQRMFDSLVRDGFLVEIPEAERMPIYPNAKSNRRKGTHKIVRP